MIPAILALPAAEGVLGSVAGGLAGTVSSLFSSPSSATSGSSSTVSPQFASMLNQVSSRAHTLALSSPMGSMTNTDLGQMSDTDLRSWMMGLTGKHVQAVDAQGHTVSGTVEGYSQTGGTMGLNINGHLVSLSGLTQISWSPSIHTH